MRRLNLLTSKNSEEQKKRKLKIDYYLLIVVVVLSLFGLLMVYSASYAEGLSQIGDKYHFIKQQGIWFILGFLALAFFSIFDYHNLEKFANPFFLFSLLLLILVFIPGFGVAAGGAHRWLKVGPLTIQPAEIVKLSSIIILSLIFQQKKSTTPFLIILTIVTGIIGIFQKDLGSAIVFAMITFGMYYLSGAPVRHFIGFLFLGGVGIMAFILSAPYRKERILAFLNPFADPQGYSYHILQVLIALGSGGFWGLGIGQSRQKYNFIPEVTTDSIFSVIGEELGFIGAVFLFSLFLFLILRCFKIIERTVDEFGRNLAAGLTLWLASQAVVNLAAMVSLIPLTGVPLPFISYGGSALLANLAAIGILLNISKQGNR